MRVVFGSWKYIFKNLWFVLPFAIVPAVFLALTLDYSCINAIVKGFFTGEPQRGFLELFRSLSIIRVDSLLGMIYSICAYICTVFFMPLMLALAEKHMRLGKRTLNGAFAQLGNNILFAAWIAILYLAVYEIWAIILSAILFAIGVVRVTAVVYLLSLIVFCSLSFVLFFLAAIFYLWYPCKQMTGFRPYDSFLYSYRLMLNVRGKLIVSFLISYAAAIVLLAVSSLLSVYLFYLIAFLLFILLFLNFYIRMETVYFETDKLDREDILHTFRGL